MSDPQSDADRVRSDLPPGILHEDELTLRSAPRLIDPTETTRKTRGSFFELINSPGLKR
jgi:hypothetical protein